MISEKTLKTIEFDKILEAVKSRAVLDSTRAFITEFSPSTDYKDAELLLKKTTEAYTLLYKHSIGGIYYFSDVTDELKRANVGGTLSAGELLKISANLKSARLIKTAIESVHDGNIVFLKEISSLLFINPEYEKEIADKIVSEDEISDNASPKLFSIRKNIRNLNARIRETLNSYMRGNFGKYLQDSVVTMRGDRYVIPVKSEYKSFIKGFVHDQSSSGSTVFIEPELVMDLNNELKSALLDEQNEIHKILYELTVKVTFMSDGIKYNAENLSELDFCFARAIYSFENKCSVPILNDKGIIDVKGGRHPLIDKNKVVPVSVALGEKYNFILITGPNTGGKTVTLKLVGLLTVMAMSGLYIPAYDESKISVFTNVYCDIGDEQSIEQNLSTFSSHIKNIINIVNNVDEKSLVLLDEIGAGTDPDEGSALALAIIENLLESNCYGIITTHYSKLKEYAVTNDKIENASMEFDAENLKPLYKLNVGIPGSSNALKIAKMLGLNKSILDEASKNLSDKQCDFENVLKKAEESRRESDRLANELLLLKEQKDAELNNIKEEREKIAKERERIYSNAKAETKRIVADKLSEAEEIIDELKSILKRAGLESKEVFRAGQLKNRLQNSRYLTSENDDKPFEMVKAKALKIGDKVYVDGLGAYGVIKALNDRKNEAEVLVGDIKTVVKIKNLYNKEQPKEEKAVKVYKQTSSAVKARSEINVLGKTTIEALEEVEAFIAEAVMYGLEEVKIIHGVGEGALLKSIREYLKSDKRVKEFRKGRYGEGENGVTIVTLK